MSARTANRILAAVVRVALCLLCALAVVTPNRPEPSRAPMVLYPATEGMGRSPLGELYDALDAERARAQHP